MTVPNAIPSLLRSIIDTRHSLRVSQHPFYASTLRNELMLRLQVNEGSLNAD